VDLNHARLPIPPLRPLGESKLLFPAELPFSGYLRAMSNGAGTTPSKPRGIAPFAAVFRKEFSFGSVGPVCSSGRFKKAGRAMAEVSGKIPPETGAEIRRLAHDLSNSLEIILQASYLLQMSNLDDGAKKWAVMVDQGSQQAAEVNRQLREFVRSHTA
jgi:hypothetical protein